MDLVLKGKQGKTLSVVGDHIRIAKKGMLGGSREKTIPIDRITSVEVKKPGGFAGFIQFSLGGSKARDSSFTMTGGAMGAAQDENSVMFNGKAGYEIALQIKDYVESWGSGSGAPAPSAAPAPSVGDQVRDLKALLDEGLITQEEFDAKKAQILGI